MILAINGGPKTRKKLFGYQTSIGKEEVRAVQRVVKSTLLSSYRGTWAKEFWGGTEIQALEREWGAKYKVKHVIPCNSCTSALFIACGATGVGLDDEVIVTPWSMTCSASVPMAWGAKPIFADICYNHFSLDPKDVEKKITPYTKAIIVVSLFGIPFKQELMEIARRHKLIVIEDAAQAVGATYNGKLAGTLGDIGCFSFTQGKHMTAGEGGLIVTNNDELALKCRLIMNHAESVVNDMSDGEISPGMEKMFGFNLRMTEIQAAIIREQLKKWKMIVVDRKRNSDYLARELGKIPGVTPAILPKEYKPSYYVMPFYYDEGIVGVPRDKFIKAFAAELMPEKSRESEGEKILVGCGYIKPIYRMPLFKQFECNPKDFPCVEKLWKDSFFLLRMIAHPLTIEKDLKDVVRAMWKVYDNRGEIG